MKTRPLSVRPTRRPARGFSLIEVLVVVTLSTVVVGTAISLLIGMQQWDRRFRGRGVECERLLELAETLRADIRSAAAVTSPAAEELLIEFGDGSEARYSLDGRGCTRSVESVDAAGQRTELYAIGNTLKWNLDRDTSGRRPLIHVTVERSGETPRSPRRVPLLVYGALGADAIDITLDEGKQ